MVDGTYERADSLVAQAQEKQKRVEQARDRVRDLLWTALQEDAAAQEIQRKLAAVDGSIAQERSGLVPALRSLLGNLQTLVEAREAHAVDLGRRRHALLVEDERVSQAEAELEQAVADQWDQLGELGEAYAGALAVHMAADSLADRLEREALDRLAKEDKAYAAARAERSASREAMQGLQAAISALQETRTEQARAYVAGLEILWAKPAERTAHMPVADAAKVYPGLGLLLDIRKEASKPPAARISPATGTRAED